MNEDKNFLKCIKRLFPDVPGSFFKIGDDGQYPEPIQDHWIVWQESAKNAVPESCVVFPKDPDRDLYRTFYDAFNSANGGNTAQCFKVAYKAIVDKQSAIGGE